jgi:hypothetical protein
VDEKKNQEQSKKSHPNDENDVVVQQPDTLSSPEIISHM